MAGQGNKRSAPRLPEAPPQSEPTASTLDEAPTPAFACCWVPPPLGSYSREEVRPRGVLQRSSGKTPLGWRGPGATADIVSGMGTAAARKAALPVLESGESEQRLEGDFKYSNRSGRNIYTPAFSNMLYFLTL